MTKFFSKSRNRFLLLIAVLLLSFLILNLSVIFKEPFTNIKNFIEKGLEGILDKNVSIESINFLPYGLLKLNNIKIYNDEGLTYASIRVAFIKFKLLPLLLNKSIIITQATFIEPLIFSSSKGIKISRDKIKTVGRYKLKLDKNFLIKAKSGKAVFGETASGLSSNSIGFNLWAKLTEAKRFYSAGWIDFKDCHFKDYLLNEIFFFDFIKKINYRLKTTLVDDTLSIDNLLLDFQQFKIEAKGLVENLDTLPVLNLKLALEELNFLENLYLKSKLFISSIRNFIVEIKGALKEPRWSVRLDELKSKFPYLPTVINVDNFYCEFKFSQEGLFIDNLYCFLNNFPIGLKGYISDFKSPSLALQIISYPWQVASLRLFNPLNFAFSFSGDKEDDSIKGKASFEIEKLVSAQPRKTEYLKVLTEELLCSFLRSKPISSSPIPVPLLVEAKNIIYQTDVSWLNTKFDLKDFKSLVYPEGSKICFDDLSISGYEGILKAKGFLDFGTLPPASLMNIEFNKFNMAQLAGVFNFDCELAGDLNGRAILDSEAASYLVGSVAIFNGYIKNLKLLDSIAEFLNIVSLEEIHFENFSSNFSFFVTGDETSIDNVKLNSKDIYLSADFKIRNRQKINGKMLVRLSTELLKESFKLKMLYFLMGKHLASADFGFEIGGFVKSPHIRWLDTEFKRNLIRFLSKTTKEMLEKKVEEAIQPILEK